MKIKRNLLMGLGIAVLSLGLSGIANAAATANSSSKDKITVQGKVVGTGEHYLVFYNDSGKFIFQ